MKSQRKHGGTMERFRDARTVGEVVRAVRRINRRVLRDRKQAKAAAKDAYLAALLPR